MKREEFNVEKIKNEEEGLSFEFGATQNAEFTSYPDNKEKVKDEVNDNPTDNEIRRPKKEEKRQKQKKNDQSSKKEGHGQSAESTISSSSASVATVVGASLVSVATLSTLIGVNVFFNGKCQMNHVESTTNSIVYELDLTDINDDECIIKLEHLSYIDSQVLKEGLNSGEFLNLTPSTSYHVSVFDVSYNNYILFDEYISTKPQMIETFTVTFVSNGGTEISSQEVIAGELVEKPADPSKEHYTFEGWYSDPNLTQEYDFNTPVRGDISLYAKWAEMPKVTINFIANGGQGEMESDQGYLDEEYILPACGYTAPTGYVFDCWQLESNASQYNPGDGYLIQSTAAINFIAVWVEAATIEFYPGIGAQGEVTSTKVGIGKEYIVPSGEIFFKAPTNKEFDYWFDDMYSEQRHIGDIITIEDTYYSFTAHWKYLDGLTFTVTFDSNGGSPVDPQVVNAGERATKPDNPTKDGYVFDGWYVDAELTKDYSFFSYVESDLVLYAKWLKLYTVTFVTGEDATQIEDAPVASGKYVTKPEDPSKDDYVFKGWFTSTLYDEEFDFLNTPITKDTTIYAKWEVAAHTVTFITNGGPEIAPQEVNDGECAIKPTDPVRGSYAFVGKDINTDSSQYYGYETDAGFSFDKYGTNYLCNKTAIPGEIVSVSLYTFSCQKISITYNVGFATTQLSGRSTAGGGSYELAGGGSDYTFNNSVEGATYFSISCNEFDNGGDYSTVACIDKIVVEYNLETGGTSVVTFDTFNNLPPGYTDSDPITFYSVTGSYNFAGWYIDSELTEEYDFTTPVTKDITLYAKWTATYSVSGAAFNGFPHSTVSYATEADVGGITLEASAYSCYNNNAEDGHGLWITLGSDSQHPEDSFSSYVANKTPINGSIESIAITVGPSAYGGSGSNATLHVTFGNEPLLEHIVSGTTTTYEITYESDATIIVECSMDGFSYFNITNVTENGLVIESIVITYTVN